MKKNKILFLAIALVIFTAAAVVLWRTAMCPLSQTISAKGYKISVPAGWTSSADGTLTDKNGAVTGRFLLINEDPDLSKMAEYSGFSVGEVLSHESISAQIDKTVFTTENGKAVQYFVRNIPNPEPYAISITLLKKHVNSFMADRIGSGLTLPVLGTNAPKKNLEAPAFDAMQKDKLTVLQNKDGKISVFHIDLMEGFMAHHAKKENTGLDILTYNETEEGVVLAAWQHIESNRGQGYLYTYYHCGNGIYTYDNNPLFFDRIAKNKKEDTKNTAYTLNMGEAELTALFTVSDEQNDGDAQATAENGTAIPSEKAESEKTESKSSVDSVPAGSVIYSSTAVISPSMKVRHPKTGKMVEIGPYAQRLGYGAYLGKSISCVIKKTGTGYLATASCGGKVLYSRSMKTQKEVQSMIAQFNAYT